MDATKFFADAPKRSVQIGETLHLFVGSGDAFTAKIEATIKRALESGKTVTENGVSRWIEKHEFINTRASVPSERYRWHADGNRVKAAKFLVTRQADGSVRKKRIGIGWVKI